MVVRNTPAARRALDRATRESAACAEMASLPVKHPHACGIYVGDHSHWVCVASTPDGSDVVREFPAHTAGLRQLVAWLRRCDVTTIALEATGVYGHVLFLTLLEAGFAVVVTSAKPATTVARRRVKTTRRMATERRICHRVQRGSVLIE